MRRLFSVFVLPLLAAFALLAATAPVRAMDMYSYDLDSLVYLSTDIVDADVVSVQTEGGLDITSVKVTRTYLGHFNIGDTVKVTAMDFFSVGSQSSASVIRGVGGRRIGAGDHLTLFLAKAKSVFLYDIPKDADIYWPAPSGVKMLDQGRIKGFEQFCNPGPYALEWKDADSLKLLPTPEQFQVQLADSIRSVEPLRLLLTKNAVPADASALLQLLRLRTQTVFPPQSRLQDAISEAASSQLVSLRNLDTLGDALAITRNETLTRPLQTPSGRDFLLRVAGDSRQPLDRRLGCAKALYSAFSWWNLPADGNFLPRLVALCGEDHPPEVTASLLAQLDQLAPYDQSAAPLSASYPAIRSGLPMLRKIHDNSSDGPVRFAVEKLIVDTLGDPMYRTLKSPCGPVISLAQPGTLPPAAGKLNYQATMRWADPAWYTADRAATLVLVNRKTREQYQVPEGKVIDMWSDGSNDGWTMQADLPASLPHGRYYVFLEFSRPNRPVSTGYGYDVDL